MCIRPEQWIKQLWEARRGNGRKDGNGGYHTGLHGNRRSAEAVDKVCVNGRRDGMGQSEYRRPLVTAGGNTMGARLVGSEIV